MRYFTLSKKSKPSPIVYGLALGGGGTKGSYEIGVWEYLIEKRIPIGAVAGTSIGSVNGAMFAMGAFKKAREAWLSLDIDLLLKSVEQKYKKEAQDAEEAHRQPRGWRPDLLGFLDEDMQAITRHALENGGIDMAPLKDFLATLIDEDKVRRSSVKYALAATDVTNFEPRYFHIDEIPKGQLLDHILASCSVPVFKLPEIDGVRYLDGAFHDNIPVAPLYDLGFKHVIAVDLSGMGINRSLKTKGVTLTHIKNSEPLGATFQFDLDQAKKNMKLGYLDAKKAFHDLSGHVYYLKKDLPESPLLAPLSEEEKNWLNSLLALPESLPLKSDLARNTLLRQIEKYRQDLGLATEESGVNFISSSLEICAEQLRVERLREYTLDALLKETMSAWQELVKSNRNQEAKGWEWLKKTLRQKNTSHALLNSTLPELVRKTEETDLRNLLMLLAVPLPRFTICALFLLLLERRQDKD